MSSTQFATKQSTSWSRRFSPWCNYFVSLEVIVEVTGKSLKVPYNVIDSIKPVWRGDAKNCNCGIIMDSNALVAFQFHILHANGIEILLVDSTKPLVANPEKWLEPTNPLE